MLSRLSAASRALAVSSQCDAFSDFSEKNRVTLGPSAPPASLDVRSHRIDVRRMLLPEPEPSEPFEPPRRTSNSCPLASSEIVLHDVSMCTPRVCLLPFREVCGLPPLSLHMQLELQRCTPGSTPVESVRFCILDGDIRSRPSSGSGKACAAG
eukprot:4874407-Prymnesium_polylepis.2